MKINISIYVKPTYIKIYISLEGLKKDFIGGQIPFSLTSHSLPSYEQKK